MDRIDSLGDDAARVGQIPAALLDGPPDQELQSLVAEAARVAHTPIAAVTIVLRRTQFFRAHVGLPADLAAARGTDRCASFCQVVVAQKGALEVSDAVSDPRVPQDLVERYGLRAYFGVPLALDGVVLGSLCVIDTQPRAFSLEQQRTIRHIADRAVERLRQLAIAPRVTPAEQSKHLASTGLTAVRGELAEISASVMAARVAVVEVMQRMRGLEQLVQQLDPGSSTSVILGDARLAAGDLEKAIDDIEHSARRGVRAARAIESATAGDGPVTVADAVSTAVALAAGGLEVVWAVPAPLVVVPRLTAVTAFGALLSALKARAAGGVKLKAEVRTGQVLLRAGTRSVEDAEAVRRQLVGGGLGEDAVWSERGEVVVSVGRG